MIDDHRVLVVEDEWYLAEDLACELTRQGAEVVGPAATLESARRLLASEPIDCAVVDLDLQGVLALPLIDWLRAEHVPTLVVSGYDPAVHRQSTDGLMRLQKPATAAAIATAIGALLA